MVAKFQLVMVSTTSKNTRLKTALQEQKNKDPNASVFTDTGVRVSNNWYLDWSRIYSIFDNDEFSSVSHEQPTYLYIHNSQLH